MKPAFDFTATKGSISLSQGEVSVCIGGSTYIGTGNVCLDLLPRAGINFYADLMGVPNSVGLALEVYFGKKEVTSFCFNGHDVEGFLMSAGGHENTQVMAIKWSPKSEPIRGLGDESTLVTRVVFHLFNFVDLFGMRRSLEQNGSAIHAIQYVDLVSDKWKVALRSLVETRDNFNLLKANGGYCITHIGRLWKADATTFPAREAQEQLDALRFFLSFAKGGWCEPVCAVGFDETGNRVWESWSSPRESWHNPPSWFDPYSSTQLATLFGGFMSRWAHSDWRGALHEVIYWYLNANHSSRGIDAGIILTQAAIERLSYELAVKQKRLLTVNGFKDLWASDKFRLLFSSLGIPIEIPLETPELQRLAKEFNWADAPHALTEIRNSLVHPENKRRGQLDAAYYEAWELGLWYLEMGVLAICGYSGTYGNRLKKRMVGQTENVPW